ncbi:MAG: efflux RND transporter permease subunit [Chitinophagales bacterium]
MRSLVSFFVKYPVWSNAVIILVIVLGLSSYFSLNKSFFPELESRSVVIEVIQPGASPQEMEEGVTTKVEESLKGIQGMEEVTSRSFENTATITAVAKKGYDANYFLSEVKNAVDKINGFPDAAEKPVVYLQKRTDRAVSLILSGDRELIKLKEMAEKIEDEFMASGLISQIELRGIPELEISVNVKEKQLLAYQIRFEEISNAIALNNRDISGGSIKTSDEEILIRSNARKIDPEKIENIIVRSTPDGSIIRLKDLADVELRFSETPNQTLFNGKNAVAIQVNKLAEEDVVAISDYIKEYLKDFNADNEDYELYIMNDQSDFLKQRLNLLVTNGTIGLVMVLITLGLFLSLRLSAWVAFAIPFCFLGMFFIGSLAGITINMISLFGMILVIGILVDDGIVVAENIFAHFEKGKSKVQAAIDGCVEVIGPVFASVSTTMLAFAIIFFLDGTLGEFITEMAIVAIACLGFSLVEALIILPSHLAYSGGLEQKKPGKIRSALNNALDFLRHKIYGRFLKICIRYYPITVATGFFFAFIVMGMFNGGIIKNTFFPPIDRDDVSVELVLTPGTRENVTLEILQEIEEKVWQVNEEMKLDQPDSMDMILATKIDIGSGGGETGGHAATLNVKLLDGEKRNGSAYEVTSAIRNKIGVIPEAQKLLVGTRAIFGKPVNVSLRSKNLKELNAAKEMLKNELEEFPDLRDISDNDVLGKREIHIKLKDKAYLLGLNHGEITKQIRNGFFGNEVQRLQIGTDEVKVWTRYDQEGRSSIDKLEKMRIKTLNGNEYLLKDLVTFEIERGIVTINHFNGSREISVSADLDNPNKPVPDILAKISGEIMPAIQKQFSSVTYEFKGQQEESSKMGASLMKIFPIILILIIILIALVFRSFSQSFLILSLIPFGVICAILGHGIEQKPVSILSFYGMIALSGVIINDAVVLLDRFNSLIRNGAKVREAAFDSGVMRFRAVMLTSITTIAGLYPLILEKSTQAQFLVPMAISVAYGVLFGTVIILTYFPAFLMIINDFRRFIHRIWYGKWPSREEVEPAWQERKRFIENELEL